MINVYNLRSKVPTTLNFSNVLDSTSLAAAFDTFQSQVHMFYQSNDKPSVLVHAQGTSGSSGM
jgi:hypothetical protein